MRRITTILALATLVACGSGEIVGGSTPTTASAPSTTVVEEESDAYPVTVEAANGEVVIEAAPERIVSLAPTATEMLFAIGAGDLVVAVDEYSTYPEEAPVTDLSGFEPNVEAIVGYEPDLVVVSDDLNDVISGLEAVDVPVLQLPAAADLDEAYSQIELLGAVTGHGDDADQLVGGMQERIGELAATVPPSDEAPTYYHELDANLFTVTSETFVGQLYQLAGLENIADAAGADSAYPQLSAEYIIEADPDLIFLADTKCCGESPETVAARPGWDQIGAVARGSVVPLDDDIASRWGPRVVDFFEEIVEAVKQLDEASS